MKIYIMADMDGISGIYDREQTDRTAGLYHEGRLFMTEDINACVQGCLEGGADEIIVRDCHGANCNVLWDKLHPEITSIKGRICSERMPKLSGSDGLILLGYHAMAGTVNAILDHTFILNRQNLWINGKRSGEFAVDAGIAGDLNIPAIMVSGDDKICREAQELVPEIITTQVKTGLARTGGEFLSREEAHKLIRNNACKAVKRCRKIKPLKIPHPVTMRTEYAHGTVPYNIGNIPYLKIIDARTYEVIGDDVQEAFQRL